jgi:PKD repeat protein
LLDAGVSAADVPGRIKQIATQNVLSNVGTGSPNFLLHAFDDGSQPPPPPVVGNEAPEVSFSTTIDAYTVDFTDTSWDNDGEVMSWNWNFGDGTSSTEQSPQHTYPANGNYAVQLTISDGEDTSAASRTIRIKVRGGNTSDGDTSGDGCSVGQRKKGKC